MKRKPPFTMRLSQEDRAYLATKAHYSRTPSDTASIRKAIKIVSMSIERKTQESDTTTMNQRVAVAFEEMGMYE